MGRRAEQSAGPGELPPGAADGEAPAGAELGVGPSRGPGTVRGLLASIIDAFKTRVDLAAVEAEIYLVYVAQLLLWGFAAVACVLLAITFGLAAMVIALWDSHRLVGVLGSMLALVVLAALCGAIGARIFRARPPLLSATLGQFEHDQRRMGHSEVEE